MSKPYKYSLLRHIVDDPTFWIAVFSFYLGLGGAWWFQAFCLGILCREGWKHIGREYLM